MCASVSVSRVHLTWTQADFWLTQQWKLRFMQYKQSNANRSIFIIHVLWSIWHFIIFTWTIWYRVSLWILYTLCSTRFNHCLTVACIHPLLRKCIVIIIITIIIIQFIIIYSDCVRPKFTFNIVCSLKSTEINFCLCFARKRTHTMGGNHSRAAQHDNQFWIKIARRWGFSGGWNEREP